MKSFACLCYGGGASGTWRGTRAVVFGGLTNGSSLEKEVADLYIQGGYPWYESGSGYSYDDGEGEYPYGYDGEGDGGYE